LTISSLPIDPLLPEIVETVRRNPITVIEAEPGAGKTTRVPAALLDAGLSDIYVLEPRRIAARMAARRVAAERGEQLGRSVGYQVRFEEETSPETRLFFLTGGVLTRKMTQGPQLPRARAVVLDEFHERQLDIDLNLALLKLLQRDRTELRVVLMSATIGSDLIRDYLSDVAIIRSPGRVFPVEVRYTAPSSSPLDQEVSAALDSALRNDKGDVLVFLPGSAEIRSAIEASAGLCRRFEALALPLHGDLPPEDQDRAVAPATQRKVIFSTNVAESSITIDGVRTVIDTGLARIDSWSPWSGLSRLRIERISRSSATQRAGRAGRTAPGFAIRLYSEEDFRRRPEHILPEILRADLAQTVLQLSAIKLRIEDLPWLVPPCDDAVDHARDLLKRLGAFGPTSAITGLGERLSRIPVHPRLARFVVAAAEFGMAKQAAEIAARLSEGRLRLDEKHRKGFASDIEAMLASDIGPTIARSRQQILRHAPHCRETRSDPHGLDKSLLVAYSDRVARRRGEHLLLSSGGAARLDRASAVHSEFLLAIEIEERAEHAVPLVRIACPIEPEWLLEYFPDRVTSRDGLEWNREAERVEQVSALLYDSLVIDESRQTPSDPDAAADLLAAKAIEAGLGRFADIDALEQLLARLQFASRYSASAEPPDGIAESALRQLARGNRSFSELAQAASNGGLERAIMQSVPMALVDEIAPTHIRLPSGRRAPIHYSAHQAPWVTSRLQDFFGMRTTPTVARGAVPLVVHLLAPNQRPVQMTQDLSSFWNNLYPQLRRELSRRYPKHKWPEDPFSPVHS
jgi:ATP-dependent helicase HrpB